MGNQQDAEMEEYSPSSDLIDNAQGVKDAYDQAQSLKETLSGMGGGGNDAPGGKGTDNGSPASGAGQNAGNKPSGSGADFGAKGKGGAANAAGDGIKSAGKSAAGEGMKEGAKKAATGAVNAATGGAGGHVLEILDVIKKASKGVADKESGKTSKKSGKGKKNQASGFILAALIALALFIMVPAIVLATFEKTVGSIFGMYTSDQAYNAAQTKQEINSDTDDLYDQYTATQDSNKPKSFYSGVLKAIDALFSFIDGILGGDEKESPYDVANKYYEAAEKSVETIDEVFLEKARAEGKGAKGGQIEQDINTIIKREDYDKELTWDSFDSEKDIYEDMNYAEFLSVMTESEEQNAENVTFENLEELAKTKKQVRLLYRLNIEEAYMTKHEAGRCNISHSDDDEEIKYGIVTLRRYYLRDIYELFELDGNATNYEFTDNMSQLTSTDGTKNVDLLDRIEPTMRSYCDVSEDADDEELLGPNERSEYDGDPKDTPIDEGDDEFEYSNELTDDEEDVIYDIGDPTVAHGQIGAEIGDITSVAMAVGQAFVNINPEYPYSNGYYDLNGGHYRSYVGGEGTIKTSWGTWYMQPVCASGSTITLKYFGLKAAPAASTSTVASSSYVGNRVYAISNGDLRVGDIITNGTGHTRIVTKIDANNVYVAGFGGDKSIKADAEKGYDQVFSKTASVNGSMTSNYGSPVVWRPNEKTMNFSE